MRFVVGVLSVAKVSRAVSLDFSVVFVVKPTDP